MGSYRREHELRAKLNRAQRTTRLAISGGIFLFFGGLLYVDSKKPTQQPTQINLTIPLKPVTPAQTGKSWNTDDIWKLPATERREWIRNAHLVKLQDETFCILTDPKETMMVIYQRGLNETRTSCATLHKDAKIENFFAKDSNKAIWDKRMQGGAQNPGPKMTF